MPNTVNYTVNSPPGFLNNNNNNTPGIPPNAELQAAFNPAQPISDTSAARLRAKGKGYRAIRQTALGVQDFLPSILQALTQAQTQQAPQLAQSELDLYKLLGPEYTRINSELNAQGQGAQAATDLGLLKGVGKDVTQQTLELQKLADPEFYALREALGAGANKLLGGINPNELSGAEIANIERTQNRSNIAAGTANTGSPLGAIKNAMTFGDKLASKQSTFAQTLNNIGNLAPNLKSGAFNYSAATGQAGAGTGQQQLGGNFNTTTQQANTLASNLLGQSGGLVGNERNIQANKIPNYERVLSALPDYS
jgi:hypothetical protein